MKKNEHNLVYLWEAIKRTNTHIIRVSEEERVEKVLKEIMVENFPNLIKDINIHILEAQETPSRIKL